MSQIIEAIGTFFDFIINTFKSLLWVISAIPQFVSTLGAAGAYLPTFLSAFFTISISVTVLYAVFKLL
jgi:hypothetical protein